MLLYYEWCVIVIFWSIFCQIDKLFLELAWMQGFREGEEGDSPHEKYREGEEGDSPHENFMWCSENIFHKIILIDFLIK